MTTHEGGHLPFEVGVTDHVAFHGPNRLTVAVNNTLTQSSLPPGNIRRLPWWVEIFEKESGYTPRVSEKLVVLSAFWIINMIASHCSPSAHLEVWFLVIHFGRHTTDLMMTVTACSRRPAHEVKTSQKWLKIALMVKIISIFRKVKNFVNFVSYRKYYSFHNFLETNTPCSNRCVWSTRSPRYCSAPWPLPCGGARACAVVSPSVSPSLSVNFCAAQTSRFPSYLFWPTRFSFLFRFDTYEFVQDYNFDSFNYAGIHRSVKLYTTPTVFLSDISVVTDRKYNMGLVHVNAVVSAATNVTRAHVNMHYQILDREGWVVASSGNVGMFSGILKVYFPKLWWPVGVSDSPGYLYTLKVSHACGKFRKFPFRLL